MPLAPKPKKSDVVVARAGDLNLSSRSVSKLRLRQEDWEDVMLHGTVVDVNRTDARVYWQETGS